MIKDYNENHFIENLIFSEQEYFHTEKGELGSFFLSLNVTIRATTEMSQKDLISAPVSKNQIYFPSSYQRCLR